MMSTDVMTASHRVEEAELSQERFLRDLLDALEAEPIEDGYSHPAEYLIDSALRRSKANVPQWIQTWFNENVQAHPSISSAILRLVGRLECSLVDPWGYSLASQGLLHSDIEVREAAIRAFEMWGGSVALDALRAYAGLEKVPWLASYIEQVIKDLSE